MHLYCVDELGSHRDWVHDGDTCAVPVHVQVLRDASKRMMFYDCPRVLTLQIKVRWVCVAGNREEGGGLFVVYMMSCIYTCTVCMYVCMYYIHT